MASRATAARRSGFLAGKAVTAATARAAVSSSRLVAPIMASTFSKTADVEGSKFGQHVFKGAVAEKYLKKQGESAKLLETSAWTEKKSDAVAAALLDWARENGASSYCHWFQPMGASGFRHGQSGQVIPPAWSQYKPAPRAPHRTSTPSAPPSAPSLLRGVDLNRSHAQLAPFRRSSRASLLDPSLTVSSLSAGLQRDG